MAIRATLRFPAIEALRTQAPIRRQSRRRRQPALQPQFPRAVLSEQIAVPNITPKHLNRFVSGLAHDGPFRRTRDCRARSMPVRSIAETRQLQPQVIARCIRQVLPHTEVTLRGLNRSVAECKLNL